MGRHLAASRTTFVFGAFLARLPVGGWCRGRMLTGMFSLLVMATFGPLAAVADASVATLVGTSQTSVFTNVSESSSGSEVIAQGARLELFSTGSAPVMVARTWGRASPAISPNGRYVVWTTPSCRRDFGGNTRDAVVYIWDDATGQSVRVITLPRGWTQVGFVGLSVSLSGRVTGLASHVEDNLCIGSYSGAPGPSGCSGTCPQAGPDQAVITAAPGTNAFRVLATGGEGQLSADQQSFALCGRHDVSVIIGDRLRLARAPFGITNATTPFCVVGDSGILYHVGGSHGVPTSLLASVPNTQVRLPSPARDSTANTDRQESVLTAVRSSSRTSVALAARSLPRARAGKRLSPLLSGTPPDGS